MREHDVLKRRVSRRLQFVAVAAMLLGFVFSPPASAHHARAEIWVGSPIEGRWDDYAYCPGTYPSVWCGSPVSHHTFFNGMPYRGDWGVDLQVGAGQQVYLYAAPQASGYNVRAKVEVRALACGARSGETWDQTRRRGGELVVVGLYANGVRSGWVAYLHINPVVSQGQWIDRWGTHLGTVGSYTSNTCWDGAHLHLEITNDTHYSCYNRGYRPSHYMWRTNFVGLVGGARVSGVRQGCP